MLCGMVLLRLKCEDATTTGFLSLHYVSTQKGVTPGHHNALWFVTGLSSVGIIFVSCAISTSTTGPDIDKIHCLKQGQPCEEGRSVLEEELKKADAVQEVEEDDRDPFGSEEDEDEECINEFWIEEDGNDQEDPPADRADESAEDGNSSEEDSDN